MKITTFTMVVFLTCASLGSSTAYAGEIEDELSAIKARLQQLENQVKKQNDTIRSQQDVIENKSKQIEELADTTQANTHASSGNKWFNKVEITGLIEVEAGHNDPDEGDDSSDIALATAEIGIAAEVTDWVSSEIILLYEEDETDLEVDVATVSIADPNGPWYLSGGQMYVPFGGFESNLISDPLTLEIGETRESVVIAGAEANGFAGGLYVFNGDLEADGDSQIDSFGAYVGFTQENEDSAFAVNAGYISDIGDSDTLQDVIQDNIDAAAVDYDDQVGGVTVSAIATFGAFNLFAEYLTATDDFETNELAFDADGAKPEAFNVELGYNFRLANMDMTAAVAYQGTDEAVALELPKERFAAAISAGIFDNTSLSLECIHDNDYSDSDGGTDEFGGTNVTAQLAVEF